MQVMLTAKGSLAGNDSLKPSSSDSLWCCRLCSTASCAWLDGATGVVLMWDIICSRLVVRLAMELVAGGRCGPNTCPMLPRPVDDVAALRRTSIAIHIANGELAILELLGRCKPHLQDESAVASSLSAAELLRKNAESPAENRV